MSNLINVFKRAIKEYGQDQAGNMAAALAFAAFFSIFPLILFLVSLASFIFNAADAQAFVLSKLPNINPNATGTDANFLSKTVTDIIAARGTGTGIAAFIGLVSLLMSASGVFGTLQLAINRAWDCEKAGSLIKDKVVAFLMVLGMAVVLGISTAISSILAGIEEGTNGIIGQMPWLWQILNILVFIGLMTGVLSVLNRVLPRCKVNWGDVWPGALLTAILWMILNQAFAFYLGNFANYQAVYGALGGIIALQTWIFLIAQILLFGAEFCSEYAGERMLMEAERAKAANKDALQQRRAAEAARAEEQRITAARRERALAERRARVLPNGGAAPAEHATVLGAAAGIAAAIGLLAKAIGGRGGRA
ncbi:MAG TPA: YihY/virulence factor BrkB family protein [Chloroflexia bacterium]|nr:YihY/virulence factor BrkB family protein [Chloroflexia bacterium]